MAAARTLTVRRRPLTARKALTAPIALSAAAALALTPLTIPAGPAVAAESVSFYDENPGDGMHVFVGSVNLLVAKLSLDDELAATVNGVAVPTEDLDAWIDVTPEVGEEATDEEWEQALDDFFEGKPTDVFLELVIYAEVPDGAELTVTIGGVSATNTMIAGPEWVSTAPTRVYTDDLADSGLTAEGTLAQASLPHVDGDVLYSSSFFEVDDSDEITRVWFELEDRTIDLDEAGSFATTVEPQTEYVGLDMEWLDEEWLDEEGVGAEQYGTTAESDGGRIGDPASGVVVSAVRGGGEASPERTGEDDVDAQLERITSWHATAVEDGTFAEAVEDEETATLAEIAGQDDLDFGFHSVYGSYAGGEWEFWDDETMGMFSVRHGSAPGTDPEPTPTATPTPEPTDEPSPAPSETSDDGGNGDAGDGGNGDAGDGGNGDAGDSDRDAGRDGSGRLPRTGAAVTGAAALGGLLIAAGTAAVVASRRRRS